MSKECIPPKWLICFCVVTCISCQAQRINCVFVVIYHKSVNSFMYYGHLMMWKTSFLLHSSDSIKQALGAKAEENFLSCLDSY